MEKDPTFVSEYGAIIIALIALIQPWIFWIWKRLLKPTQVEFYETGTIELGFSQHCTTIGINGTLRTIERDIYVKKMTLELERKRDSSKHLLNWAVFRGTKINLSNSRDVEVELPYGFLLSKDSPRRLNIQFHDYNQQEELRPSYNSLTDNWEEFLNASYPVEDQIQDNDQDYELKMRQVYNEFISSPEATDPYSNMDRNFYLEEGDYKLKLIISTSNPNKEFVQEWDFTLNEQDSRHIRSNVIDLVNFGCDQFSGSWNFSYANYEKN